MVSQYRRCIETRKAKAYLVIDSSWHSPAQEPILTPCDRTHVQTKPRTCLYLALGDIPALASSRSSKHLPALNSAYFSHVVWSLTYPSLTNSCYRENFTLFHHLKNKPPPKLLKNTYAFSNPLHQVQEVTNSVSQHRVSTCNTPNIL